MAIAKVTSKGQITVPKRVREALGLSAGDELEFVEEDGQFLLRKRLRSSPFDRYLGYLKHKRRQDPDETLKELRGSVKARRKPEDFDKVRQQVKRRIASKAARG